MICNFQQLERNHKLKAIDIQQVDYKTKRMIINSKN